jgi:hypothetical protein
MGKGGSSTQRVEQTNLPSYAKQYFQDLMGAAGAETFTRDPVTGQITGLQPYERYEDERIAGFDPAEMQAQQNILGMQAPGQFQTGTSFVEQAGRQALQAGQYQPGQFNVQQVQTPELQQFQAQGPGAVQGGLGSFAGQGVAQQFMSPYQQAVTDVQKQAATREAQLAQQQANLGSARQGTYGGARQALGSAERERGLLDRLSNIQAQGSQAAFEQAQRAFEQEQGRGLQAGLQTQRLGSDVNLANLQALLGVQQLGSGQSMEAQRLNQAMGLEGQRLGEQSRQFAGDLGLRGATAGISAGETLGRLGGMQQETDLARFGAQRGVGAERRGLDQQRLDQKYADFLRQRDYPMEQLGYYANLLRGLPMQLNTTSTTYGPTPSMLQQAGGTAAGIYGLSRAMGGSPFKAGGEVKSQSHGLAGVRLAQLMS